MIYNFSSSNSIVNQYLKELRSVNIQNDSMRFRRNLKRISSLMAFEISKTFSYEKEIVTTPLGEAEINIPIEFPVLMTILRAGLPMQEGMLEIFDHSPCGYVSAYRKHHKNGTFEIAVEYISCPNLQDRILVLNDPMLATGQSLDTTIKAIQQYGIPKEIHIASIIASQYGIEFISKNYPNAKIWVAVIDEELTAKSYIVPGLGDAGDLAFGVKEQQ
jgi:uracil phosphoribosyltransferase